MRSVPLKNSSLCTWESLCWSNAHALCDINPSLGERRANRGCLRQYLKTVKLWSRAHFQLEHQTEHTIRVSDIFPTYFNIISSKTQLIASHLSPFLLFTTLSILFTLLKLTKSFRRFVCSPTETKRCLKLSLWI